MCYSLEELRFLNSCARRSSLCQRYTQGQELSLLLLRRELVVLKSSEFLSRTMVTKRLKLTSPLQSRAQWSQGQNLQLVRTIRISSVLSNSLLCQAHWSCHQAVLQPFWISLLSLRIHTSWELALTERNRRDLKNTTIWWLQRWKTLR